MSSMNEYPLGRMPDSGRRMSHVTGIDTGTNLSISSKPRTHPTQVMHQAAISEPQDDSLAPREHAQATAGGHSTQTSQERRVHSTESPVNIQVDTERGKQVSRNLRGIHIFMITISALLGVGLYVRGGVILRLGGPLAVLLSFLLLGLLSWAVMQCITEMICLWPIAGALNVYVSEFVDPELGTAVGIAYWWTYSISFAALIAATASEASYWNTPRGIQGTILFLVIPGVLVVANSFGVEYYGFIEVLGGSAKLAFFLVIVIVMISINTGAGKNPSIGARYFSSDLDGYDSAAAPNWMIAFFMCLSIAAFAYVGVEVVAATALEARVVRTSTRQGPAVVRRTIKFSAAYISFFATIIYFLGGLLISLNIKWDDCRLPRVSWITADSSLTCQPSSPSAFVLITQGAQLPVLSGTLTVFLMVTALSCANTNLYVASRTLFGLCKNLSDGPNGSWYIRFFASLGKTNDRMVPVRAMVASCVFIWVPFLYLGKNNENGTPIGSIIDVLSEMGSVGVVCVWTCEVWAFIRFFNSIHRHRQELGNVLTVRRWHRETIDDPIDNYPYRSHWQPYLAYLALGGCLFILVIANGASLWARFHSQPFLSAYLAPLCFIVLWIVLKLISGREWQLVDLSDGKKVEEKLRVLNRIATNSLPEILEARSRTLWNLYGFL